MLRHAASALLLGGIQRILSSARTIRLVLDVSAFAKQGVVPRYRIRRQFLFDTPLQLGGVDVLSVHRAGLALSLLDGRLKRRNRNRSQDSNDGNDDHDFNEGECFL